MKPNYQIWTERGDEGAAERAQNRLRIAADYLAQFSRYSQEMRKIGRGFDPSGPYGVDDVRDMLVAAAADLDEAVRQDSECSCLDQPGYYLCDYCTRTKPSVTQVTP